MQSLQDTYLKETTWVNFAYRLFMFLFYIQKICDLLSKYLFQRQKSSFDLTSLPILAFHFAWTAEKAA